MSHTKPHDLSAYLQACLHQDGLLDDPDYYFDDEGRLTFNVGKLRRYLKQHKEPWF